jgi:hypothetical protein
MQASSSTHCKVVNGVDPDIEIGAFRFPNNAAIGVDDAAAKEAPDAVMFGRRIAARAGNWLTLVAALGASMWTASASAQNATSPPRTPRMAGSIDFIRFEGDQFHISGWACQVGNKAAIDVRIYADHSAVDNPKGKFVFAGKANLDNEAAVDGLCGDQKGKHRFWLDIPNPVLATYRGRELYAHGFVGGVEGPAFWGSGAQRFPDPPVFRHVPETLPALSGTYVGAPQHPRVFTTPADLHDLIARINIPDSFSAQSFVRLADRVKRDLAGNTDWDATYSGCDEVIYLYGFSIEVEPAYGNTRTPDQLRAAMHVRQGVSPPRGAALVASRLALYAALVRAGAAAPPGAPDADKAVALAKKILLAWTTHGFRDETGNLRKPPPSCGPELLTVTRGLVYSIHAQDLLQGLHAFAPEEEAQLNSFHRTIYEWIRVARNESYVINMKWKYPEEVYNNQFANHLVALLAAARLFDDKERFYAALDGREAIPVSLPWTRLFNYVIYGVADTPLIRVTPNSSEDPIKSNPAYSTKAVAPGEINDRYRNLNPLQSIGYSMATLMSMFETAEVMRIAGIDAYAYRGTRQQSIEMATQYYACYAQHVGFYNAITPDSARACPDYQQYVGKVVNDVESAVLIGAYRFPGNVAITALDAGAKAQVVRRDVLDPISFGRWKN